MGVAVHRLPELVAAIECIGDEHAMTIGVFGHVADGNLHPTIVHDPADAAQRERARQAFEAIVTATLELGGTISGEHGIGVHKAEYVERQVGRVEQDVMRRVKAVFDPANILNPGRGF